MIPSPAILERIGLRFRKAVTEFAADNGIPVIRFAKGDRKLEVMRPHLEGLVRAKRTGVAAVGVAQEFQAMAIARAVSETDTGVSRALRVLKQNMRDGAKYGINASRIAYASTVHDYAPDLVPA